MLIPTIKEEWRGHLLEARNLNKCYKGAGEAVKERENLPVGKKEFSVHSEKVSNAISKKLQISHPTFPLPLPFLSFSILEKYLGNRNGPVQRQHFAAQFQGDDYAGDASATYMLVMMIDEHRRREDSPPCFFLFHGLLGFPRHYHSARHTNEEHKSAFTHFLYIDATKKMQRTTDAT